MGGGAAVVRVGLWSAYFCRVRDGRCGPGGHDGRGDGGAVRGPWGLSQRKAPMAMSLKSLLF